MQVTIAHEHSHLTSKTRAQNAWVNAPEASFFAYSTNSDWFGPIKGKISCWLIPKSTFQYIWRHRVNVTTTIYNNSKRQQQQQTATTTNGNNKKRPFYIVVVILPESLLVTQKRNGTLFLQLPRLSIYSMHCEFWLSKLESDQAIR